MHTPLHDCGLRYNARLLIPCDIVHCDTTFHESSGAPMTASNDHENPLPPPGVTPAQQSVNGWNAQWVDDLYLRWKSGDQDIPESWCRYFDGFELGIQTGTDHSQSGDPQQASVTRLIDRYRHWGHEAAHIDPLNRRPRRLDMLSLDAVGLSTADLDQQFQTGDLAMPSPAPLRDIVERLDRAWCGPIGVEFDHLRCSERRAWWQKAMESMPTQGGLSSNTRLEVLSDLQEATGLERFLSKRYVGSKWFSLAGGEVLIPMLHHLVRQAAEDGVEEIALGMAHRGRINVLVNILQKSYGQLFTEFEEAWTEDFLDSGGDVKYHRGYSSDITTPSGHAIHLTMASNPSHLEWGHPVVLGRLRAKQRLRGDTSRRRSIPVLVHGDAALPGQGIVQELCNASALPAYEVGGVLHIVINNQIGFTAEPNDCYPGPYCTDVLRGFDIPILHLNGDDPDYCVAAMGLALQYRQQFGSDVAIDLWGYRLHGHNETDEPAFTNPTLYQAIRSHQPVVESYADRLAADGLVTADQAKQDENRLLESMHEAQERIRQTPVRPTPPAFDDDSTWAGFSTDWDSERVDTTVPQATLQQISNTLGTVPDGFTPHHKIERLLASRRAAVVENAPLDWAMGELLAYGSLLLDGYPIRLTGEDVQRGTFSHRHIVLFDSEHGTPWSPLDHIDVGQSRLCVHNSPVTEGGCIGFEYGYSLGDPNILVVWEAQFGDFANAGQVYFDQFIASAERKWNRHSGLVCLLPHGYEGAGPEHSSARLERFLQLCADENIEVVQPTTPAQMFHLLRRQMRRRFRKPLIVLTPKSLLRHPAATSAVEELTGGCFRHVIDDPSANPSNVTRVLLCSGKIAYDLMSAREKDGIGTDTAIVRLEQLYPFPEERIAAILKRYTSATNWTWVQEEPRNAGAWTWIADRFQETLQQPLGFIGRPANASPAVGSARQHRLEQQHVVEVALGAAAASTSAFVKETRT